MRSMPVPEARLVSILVTPREAEAIARALRQPGASLDVDLDDVEDLRLAAWSAQ